MVKSCSAVNCTNRFQKGSGIHFFKFPLKKKDMLSKWLAAMRRDKWVPKSTDFICSAHFESSCFRHYALTVQLKEDAVPSQFSFPLHLQKRQTTRRVLVRNVVGPAAGGTATSTSVSDCLSKDKQAQIQVLQEHHNYALTISPRGLKRKYEQLQETAKRRRLMMSKKIKSVRRQLYRCKARLRCMADVIRELKKRHDISCEAVGIIERCFGSIPSDLLKRKLLGKSKESYSDVIRSFALTLHFYSPKAYEFVRKSFGMSLPHSSTLRKWAAAVDGKPGFTQAAFSCLEKLASNDQLICTLVFDEMAIRKNVQYNGSHLEGLVDYGTDVSDDSLPVASEVLMFLLVPLKGNWKIPIAYFLIDGMSAEEKYNLVNEALQRLYAINVLVVAITCDGPATNFALADRFGAKINASDMKPYFSHPSDPAVTVYFIFDACHMLKLMRNTLADKQILTDDKGRQIRWQYIKDLFEIQDTEGLRAANKLKRNHIEWYQQKMKVSLAAQSLSRSVANALEFVSVDLNLPKFTDSSATVEFIRIIDQLFDTLNSKSPLAKEFKSVMRPTNEKFFKPFLERARQYLLSLKLGSDMLHSSPRKTTVLGFAATITSVLGLYDTHVRNGALQYLATYRLSQDHIELAFNVIRSRGRWNNNPTAGQFRCAYRQLLLKHDAKPSSTGNVVAQESLPYLSGLSDHHESVCSTSDILRRCGLQRDEVVDNEHSYCIVPDKIVLSEFSSNVVTYMSGYVVAKLCAKLKCVACKSCLLSRDQMVSNCKLLSRKNNGGLVIPSESVVKICTVTERCIRQVCNVSLDQIPRQKNINLALQVAVIEKTQDLKLFTTEDLEHSCNVGIIDSFQLNLIRLIVNYYVNVRFYAIGKRATDKLRGRNVRFNSNKQVLFAHQ